MDYKEVFRFGALLVTNLATNLETYSHFFINVLLSNALGTKPGFRII